MLFSLILFRTKVSLKACLDISHTLHTSISECSYQYNYTHIHTTSVDFSLF